MPETPGNPPSPELFFETVQSYQRTAAIKTAIELDVFSAIAAGHHSPKALGEQCKASPRGMRLLCDYLTVLGFLTKHEEYYELTESSGLFLNKSSPAYVGSVMRFLLAPQVTAGFDKLTEAVRKGGTALSEMGSTEPDWPAWVEFARAMAPMMAPAAEAIAGLLGSENGEAWNVLDLAAGHGLFGQAIARHNPQARVVAVDWPAVLEVAQENAVKSGVEDRFRTLPGDAFEVELGSDFDVVLLTNLLHHFDLPTCEKMMKRVHAALKPGGRAVTLEFVPDDSRVAPPLPAKFGLQMLAGTPGGDAYTFVELEAMARAGGFSRSEIHPLEMSPESVVISFKD